MRKKRAYILLALLALLLLSGCAAQTQKREPVLALQCTHPTSLSTIRPAGDGAVAVCWEDYENLRTTIQLVDTAYDTVRKEVTLEGVWNMKEQSFADGGFTLCDRDTNTWKLLSADLREVGTMEAENVDGFFSYDGGSYYFLRGHVLYRQTVADGQTVPVTMSQELRMLDIAAFDAASGQMAVEFFLSPYNTECGTALLDVATGQVSMVREERYQTAFTGGGLCLLHFDTDAMGYSALYGSGDQFYFADAGLFLDAAGDLYALPGSSLLMGVLPGQSTLYAVDEAIRACALSEQGISGEMYTACYLPQEHLVVGAVYENGAFRLYALDTAQLTFRPVADSAPQ